jgi:hypothetical protein
MTRLPELWSIIESFLSHSKWASLQEIYRQVEKLARLDKEDFEPESPSSDGPKWKRNVRNVLQYRKKTREIEWDGDTKYRRWQ